MFRAAWTWVLPLVGAAATFCFVLLTTPPGFASMTELVLGSPRGASADAVAYALGAASSLALLVLLVLAALAGLVERAAGRFQR